MSCLKKVEEFTSITGVIDNAIVQNATLDQFAELHPEALVIDDDISVFDLAKKYTSEHKTDRTTFFIDCTSVLDQYKHWYETFKVIQPYYAIKCNPDPLIADLICTFPNICFDCASPGEIAIVLKRGIPANHIIYANTIKSASNINYFRDNNVWCSTVDCVEEVEKMYNVLGEDFKKCKLVVRVWVDDSHASNPLGSKFGAHLDEMPEILDKIKEYEGTVVGVSFHVGSGCHDSIAYKGALESTRKIYDMCAKLDFHPQLIDLGGGWQGITPAEDPHELPDRAQVVFDSLKEYGFNKDELQLISEPGRYFNDHTITLVTPVLNVKKYPNITVYTMGEGIFGGFKEHYLSNIEYNLDILTQKNPSTVEEPAGLIGPSGHPKDIIKMNVMLPPLSVGDLTIWKNMGAYTMSESSKFARHNQVYVCFIRKSSLSPEYRSKHNL